MGDSEETLKQNNEILKAIADLSAESRRRFNEIEAKLDKRVDELEAKLDKRVDELEAKFDKRIDGLEAGLDSYQKFSDAQFEAIREGIVFNSVRFDRLESEFFKVRSDISSIRADIKEMGERRRKELV